MSAEIVKISDECPVPASVTIDPAWFTTRDKLLSNVVVACDSQAEYEAAEISLKKVGSHSSKLDKQRLEFVRPLTSFAKDVKSIADKARTPLEEAKAVLKSLMTGYVMKQRIAEEKRIEAEAQAQASNPFAAMLVAKQPEPEELKTTASSVREEWRYEIENESLIPREFMTPDVTKIKVAVNANKAATSIPGIRVYSQVAIQAR